LLGEVIALSNGVVSRDVIQSGEVVTEYTLEAERVTKFYTNVDIATRLTEAEAGLSGGAEAGNRELERRVISINRRALVLLEDIIQFKTAILSDVLTCKMFTMNYPLLIDHILREAKFYLRMLEQLQKRETIDMTQDAMEHEIFWNNIMAEHSKFIRGLLDPTENTLISTANDFANEFDQLTDESKAAAANKADLEKVTQDSLEATKAIRDFKAQGTEGILDCKVKSIIIPLLADHTLREASHFLRLLEKYENENL
jgi:hypothetical protein